MGSNIGKTAEGNVMVGRLMILLCVAVAKHVWWNVENPKGSLLEGHVLFQEFLRLRHVVATKVTCNLGWFGGDTLKPVWIYSSHWLVTRKILLFCLVVPPTYFHEARAPTVCQVPLLRQS